MFSFLLSEQGKMRRNAANWLEVADRIAKFRRDQLTDTQNQRLAAAAGELKLRLKDKADASRLKMAIESLEVVLRDTGGRIYPMSSMVENVEFFLVAAIVILGIRAYFVQPFKIPTNSMWPSYYGITHETDRPGQEPGLARKAWRFLTLGGWHYQANAPADGEVTIPVFSDGSLAFTQVPGRTAGVIPTTKREYTLGVGGKTTTVVIPGGGTSTEDFRIEKTFEDMLRTTDGTLKSLAHIPEVLRRQRNSLASSLTTMTFNGQKYERRVYWIPTGRRVKTGEPVLSFDLLTGDLLFVDRISYNFVRPKVGQGFVFHTRKIPVSPPAILDQYYIKRLVGVPGDDLEIREPVLFRNGAPITGAEAFKANAEREDSFRGYFNAPVGRGEYLLPGQTVTLPDKTEFVVRDEEKRTEVRFSDRPYFALGDNSAESLDSRYWGFVPGKEVVGKPLFIYYPFTRRWGLAD